MNIKMYEYLYSMTFIFESNKSLTNILCDSIIEEFEEEHNEIKQNWFIIPKKNEHWERIERILYKELLIRLNEYKMKLIGEINTKNDLILLLNKTLYTKDFIIQKLEPSESCISKYYFKPNRYNVLTYIFYLNNIEEGGEVIITVNSEKEEFIRPKKGCLILLPENIEYPYKCQLPKKNAQYIITGQLCYDNIV